MCVCVCVCVLVGKGAPSELMRVKTVQKEEESAPLKLSSVFYSQV